MFKFDTLSLKSGDQIQCGRINVLVGANNSGKTTFLKEVSVTPGLTDTSKSCWLDAVDFNEDGVRQQPDFFFEKKEHSNSPTLWSLNSISRNLSGIEQDHVTKKIYGQYVSNDPEITDHDRTTIQKAIGKFLTGYMSAEDRLLISKRTPAEDIKVKTPSSVINAFFHANTHRELDNKLRAAFKEAFNLDLAFDYTRDVNYGFRVGNTDKVRPEHPKDFGQYLYQNNYRELDTEGDGYRSFVSAVLGLLTTAPKVLLLDEPEAFLHQEQAETLGRLVARLSKETGQQVFVATHSASFLWGLLKEEPETSVLRVSRRNQSSNILHINQAKIEEIFSNPLFASQRVLDALFNDAVMVCEGDSDRVVFDYALTKHFDRKGVMVIHGHNKQNALKITKFVRELGSTVCDGLWLMILPIASLTSST